MYGRVLFVTSAARWPVNAKRLVLGRGDVAVFRGDLVHGGAAFPEFNIRMHTYLDVECVVRNDHDTYFMDNRPYILPRVTTEDAALKQLFSVPDCRFKRISINGDGTCMMGTIWHWLRVDGRHEKSGFELEHDMTKKISRAALEVPRERSRNALSDGERAQCEEVWTSIDKNVNKLKAHWKSPALDYTWSALTRLLGWVNVEVWQWSEQREALAISQTYPQHTYWC